LFLTHNLELTHVLTLDVLELPLTFFEQEEQITDQIERHNFHIQKLEMLIRLVDQGESEGLDRRIKETLEDDLNYYIAESTDPDFAENEYMYDDFDEEMEACPAVEIKETSRSRKDSETAAEKKKESDERAAKEKKEREKREKETAAAEEKKRKQAEATAAKAAATKAKAEASKVASQGLVAVGGRVGKQAPAVEAPRLPVAGINFAAAASAAAGADCQHISLRFPANIFCARNSARSHYRPSSTQGSDFCHSLR
jgi:CCR4-NOT transcriptional regulation complex NOT5 subunit